MKILLVFPPLWDINLSPMLGLPLIAGMLKEQGYDVEIFDINSLFMNFISSKEFYFYYEKKIKFFEEEFYMLKKKQKHDIFDINLSKYFTLMINSFNANKEYLLNFYEKYSDAHSSFVALENESTEKINKYYKLLNDIILQTFKNFYNFKDFRIPKKYFLFYEWEQENVIKVILEKNTDLIGFSLSCEEQFFWSLQLSKEIKTKSNPMIVFGGSEIMVLGNVISNFISFNSPFDAIIYGEGELSFTLLAKKEPFKNIPNLIYFDKKVNKVVINSSCQKDIDETCFLNPKNNNVILRNVEKIDKVDRFYKPNYRGIDFDSYFLPQKVLSVESSRGCYWNKCEFCLYMDGKSYQQKNVDLFIEEIKDYVERYKINRFFFTDSGLHPEYAREFSRKILERKINIKYASYVRLEKDFDYDLLKLMYDGGFRIGLWGLESGSDRILKLFNKGTTSVNNSRILKTAKEIGIYNFCWVLVQFPKETVEDLNLTKKFVIDHFDFIDLIQVHTLALYKNAPIAKHPKDFGLDESCFEFNTTISGYKKFAPKEIVIESEKVFREITDLFKQKNDYDFKHLSNTLVKLATIKE